MDQHKHHLRSQVVLKPLAGTKMGRKDWDTNFKKTPRQNAPNNAISIKVQITGVGHSSVPIPHLQWRRGHPHTSFPRRLRLDTRQYTRHLLPPSKILDTPPVPTATDFKTVKFAVTTQVGPDSNDPFTNQQSQWQPSYCVVIKINRNEMIRTVYRNVDLFSSQPGDRSANHVSCFYYQLIGG